MVPNTSELSSAAPSSVSAPAVPSFMSRKTVALLSIVLIVLAVATRPSTALPTSYLQFLQDDNALRNALLEQSLAWRSANNNNNNNNNKQISSSGPERQQSQVSIKDLVGELEAASDSEGGPRPLAKRSLNTPPEHGMLRLVRNMPQHASDKMYQITNIGDLPMFRFG